MNINFELYRVFYTVAKVGNITKASQELLISQPAISKSIKKLEEELGGQLFIRTKRGVFLTEEGKEFYRYISLAMDFINNAENRFNDLIHLETGTIKIGISTTLTKKFLIPFLEKFHKEYPKIEIKIYTNITSSLINMLKNGLIDLVILNLPYKGDDKDIEMKEIKKIHDCFIVNKDYEDLTHKKLTLNDLNKYPLVLQLKGSNTRNFLDDFCLKNDVVLNSNMNLASYSLVTEFVKIGFGIGYATKEYIKEELKNKELFKLDVSPALPSRSIGLAYSKNTLPNFSTRKFIEILLNTK